MEKAEIEKLYNQAKCRLDVNDPDLDCVTNLICYGFLLIKYADKSNRNQLVREFDEHCFKATNFFDGPAGQGNAPQDRVAIVKDGAAWVNRVKQWVITGLSGQLDPKEFEYLCDKQRELMARCKIMYTISMEKSKSSLLKEIKQAIEARKASGKAGDIKNRQPAERGGKTKVTIVAIIISLFIICAFELSVWLMPFTLFAWLKNHSRSHGIQGSAICLIPCLIFGFFKPRWRKWWWGTAIAFLVGLLTLL